MERKSNKLAEADKRRLYPGTEIAINAGCTCPYDQPRAFRGEYWYHSGCPVHGFEVPDLHKDKPGE